MMNANSGELFHRIRELGRAMDVFDRYASRELGINRSDLHALNALEDGPRSHGDLAEALGLTSGAVTTVVDRLVDAGYVERQPDSDDRRKSQVALLPPTYQAFARVYRPCGDAVGQALQTLTPPQQRAAATALALAARTIVNEANKLPDGSPETATSAASAPPQQATR